jgi:hypothetical protein
MDVGWRAEARTTSAAKQIAVSMPARHTRPQHHQSKIGMTEHSFNRAYSLHFIAATSPLLLTLLNHGNRHAPDLPPTSHRSPFPSIPGTRSTHPILVQQRVMSIPCHTAGSYRSIPQFGFPALRQQRANANVDVTLASTYLRYHY